MKQEASLCGGVLLQYLIWSWLSLGANKSKNWWICTKFGELHSQLQRLWGKLFSICKDLLLAHILILFWILDKCWGSCEKARSVPFPRRQIRNHTLYVWLMVAPGQQYQYVKVTTLNVCGQIIIQLDWFWLSRWTMGICLRIKLVKYLCSYVGQLTSG